MTEDEKNFIRKIYIDKAKNTTIIPILLMFFSLLTYVIPIIYGVFDFGVIFEIISIICLMIAKDYMLKNDEIGAKKFIIFSMLSIGWIMIYDAMYMFLSVQSLIDILLLGVDFFLGEILSILYLIFLFMINRDLSKADNPEKYKDSIDWFYEKYNGEKKSKNV